MVLDDGHDAGWPDRITAPGLDGEVEVRRDRHGVAHMRAGSVHDAFYAQGYFAARDRGLHMEYDRRRAQGRWAQVVGAEALADDSFVRRIGLAAAARQSYELLDGQTKAIMTAYADGVNQVFSAGLPSKVLPMPLEPWEPWHCCAVYLGRHVWMGSLSHKLFRTAMLPSVPADLVWRLRASAREELAVVPTGAAFRSSATGPGPDWGRQLADWLAGKIGGRPGGEAGEKQPVPRRRGPAAAGISTDPAGGSNNWAVSGSRTTSGRPLLAGDPHRPLESPGPYWQNHVSCDAFDAIGLSFPGVPGFPHFGHTANVAWSITHGMADDQDLFIEQLDGLPVRTEPVEVLGAEPVELVIRRSPRGGIIAQDEDAGVGLAFRWTGTAEPDPTLGCLLPMLTAGSAAEFDQAMRGWVVPVDNLLIADTAGSIRYRLRGRVVERSEANSWSAVPGWDPAYAWTGWVPFDRMPTATDPAEGFLVSANNRTHAADRPFVAEDFSSPARALRILELLRSAAELDHAAMERIQGDVTSSTALEFLELLGDARPESAPELLEILRGWDGRMALDSVAATVYVTVRQELLTAIDLPQDAVTLDHPLLPRQRGVAIWLAFPGLLAQVREGGCPLLPDWPGALSRALDRAAERLTEALGPQPETWTWQRLHTTSFAPIMPGIEPLESRPVPGDNETVRSSGIRGLAQTTATSGSVARYVFDLGDWENSGWAVPEQTDAWYAARLVPMHYAWPAVVAGSEPAGRLCPAAAEAGL
jgi:penicillin G amidase